MGSEMCIRDRYTCGGQIVRKVISLTVVLFKDTFLAKRVVLKKRKVLIKPCLDNIIYIPNETLCYEV